MLTSLDWLRSLCPFEGGAIEVARILTDRGLTVDAVTSFGDDAVLDVDVPANRPDCLGHLGLAREVAAALGLPLAPRPPAPRAAGAPAGSSVRVSVDAPELCPRYTARIVRGLRVGASPRWVVDRLEACGLRSINNVVDASNLVLLELSQPIHTFDLDRLEGATLRVRTASPGETLVTLDGQRRDLDPTMLVIADARRPAALAGIMGGTDSEIHPGTVNVVVEAAAFSPAAVRRAARRLGIKTDASHRFERGVDAGALPAAQDMTVRLLAELAGGTPAPEMLDFFPAAGRARDCVVRQERVALLLGFDPGREAVHESLAALGLAPVEESPGRVRVAVPSWRADLEREVDVIEEVARHLGYDRLPSRLPPAPALPLERDPTQEVEERARDLAGHLGFHEAVNYAMIAAGEDDAFVSAGAPPPLALGNPIAEPLARMRRSLLPALLRSVDLNLRRGVRDVRLFEVGRVFLSRGPGSLPDEPSRLGLVWTGASGPPHWSRGRSEAAFHHLAGVVDYLVAGLGPGTVPEPVAGAIQALHPGRAATWREPGSGRTLAWGGEVHPAVRRRLDLPAQVLMAEVDLTALLRLPASAIRQVPLPRVPAVTRDLSLVLHGEVECRRILDAVRAVPAPAPVEVEVLDLYTGAGLGAGEISLTVRVMLQPQDKSLTDPETEAYRTDLVLAVEALPGVRLRS